MYDEAVDFSEHLAQIASMDEVLAEAEVQLDWAEATICDVGGGGGLRAALLAARVKRAHCADIIDQQARYGGEFVKLMAEKVLRHGHVLPIERFEYNVTDATRLFYRDNWFDFVCSVNAFEHIRDPEAALLEVARIMRPGALAYVSFDPIWTADTGSHYQHRVSQPWAHLLLDDADFVAKMQEAGAEEWEIREFRGAMNRIRLPLYERLFRVTAGEMGLALLLMRSWTGVVDESHLEHGNFVLARKTYSRDELMTRGMAVLFRKVARSL